MTTEAKKVSYRYVDPGPAGPFKGAAFSTDPWMARQGDVKVGDEIWAMFGRAVITSVRAVKKPACDN